MNKKGMSLVTLTITTVVLIIVFALTFMAFTNTGILLDVDKTNQDIDLLNVQQLANMAYASVYLENLHQGIRRELTAEEVRARMIQNGTEEIKLKNYIIKIQDGDVFVSVKEE